MQVFCKCSGVESVQSGPLNCNSFPWCQWLLTSWNSLENDVLFMEMWVSQRKLWRGSGSSHSGQQRTSDVAWAGQALNVITLQNVAKVEDAVCVDRCWSIHGLWCVMRCGATAFHHGKNYKHPVETHILSWPCEIKVLTICGEGHAGSFLWRQWAADADIQGP